MVYARRAVGPREPPLLRTAHAGRRLQHAIEAVAPDPLRRLALARRVSGWSVVAVQSPTPLNRSGRERSAPLSAVCIVMSRGGFFPGALVRWFLAATSVVTGSKRARLP